MILKRRHVSTSGQAARSARRSMSTSLSEFVQIGRAGDTPTNDLPPSLHPSLSPPSLYPFPPSDSDQICPDSIQGLPNLARSRTILAQHRPNRARCRASSGKLDPKSRNSGLTSAKIGPESPELRTVSAKLGPKPIVFCHDSPRRAQIRQG